MTFVGAKLHFLCHMSNTIGSIFCVIKHFLKLFQSLKKALFPYTLWPTFLQIKSESGYHNNNTINLQLQ